MELILANSNREDITDISSFANADFDINKEMKFKVQVARSYYTQDMTFGSWIYIPDTEFGGIIENVVTDTTLDYVELAGRTPRGKMAKRIIQPAAGQDYRTVSGDAHEIMRTFINGNYSGYLSVGENICVNINSFTFQRYCTTYDGLISMLKSLNRKMVCTFVKKTNQPVYVDVSSEPIVDYSDRIELSNDNRINFKLDDNRMGVNHLIALGKGELKDRTVIHKYLDRNKKISASQVYTGYEECTEIYDFSSAEVAELNTKAEEKIMELANTSNFEMDVEKLNLDVKLGDIVGGRDYLTGISDRREISNIIYTISNGTISKTYKLGD